MHLALVYLRDSTLRIEVSRLGRHTWSRYLASEDTFCRLTIERAHSFFFGQVYFITFYLLCNFIFLPLFVATLINYFFEAEVFFLPCHLLLLGFGPN
jgi:hypothetical protein